MTLPTGSVNETQQRQLRKRKKLSLIIGIIVLMFFTCWTPWNVLEFIRAMYLAFGVELDLQQPLIIPCWLWY
jgi:hypothetical protein